MSVLRGQITPSPYLCFYCIPAHLLSRGDDPLEPPDLHPKLKPWLFRFHRRQRRRRGQRRGPLPQMSGIC